MKSLIVGAACLAALVCTARFAGAQAGLVEEFGPTAGTPLGIAAFPRGGTIWFADNTAKMIGQITLDPKIRMEPTIREYPTPGSPTGIIVGPDLNLWFTDSGTRMIGKMTTHGAITEYGPVAGTPSYITSGPDGRLWFTDQVGANSMIGAITTTGTILEYTATPAPGTSIGITAGPPGDGRLWFADFSQEKIGVITTAGSITEYPIAPPAGVIYRPKPFGITAGPDGNLWFTVFQGGIGAINTSGTTLGQWPTIGGPRGITASKHYVWFTELVGSTGEVGAISNFSNITTGGAPFISEKYPTQGNPQGITIGGDGNVWFADNSPNQIGRIWLGRLFTPIPPIPPIR